MSKTKDNIRIPNPTEGVIRTAQLDDSVSPETSVELAVNMNFDRVGTAQTRPGISTYATTLGGEVKSLGKLSIQGSTPQHKLFAQVGKNIYVYNGSSWVNVRTTTSDNKARFSQWLNYLFMVNGVDPLQASNGGNFSAVAGIVPSPAIPVGDFIQAGFDGRIWVANAANDALYFSDIVQFTPPSTFVITYDENNFIEKFSPQDGESITGLIRVPRALLLFKQNHIYRIYSATNIDPYPAYNVGTYSQESIVQTKDGVYFHHPSGFYHFSYDSQPVEISKRISDFIKAIPRDNYEKIVGIYDNFDSIKWYVGSVKVGGTTYSNCALRYTISTQVWTVYDYSGFDITALIEYDDGSSINQIAGSKTGVIASLDSGETDLGNEIYYELIDRYRSWSDIPAYVQSITGMYVVSENGAGGQVQYQKQKSCPNEWKNIGKISENEVTVFPNIETDDFNHIRFRIRGYTKGEPVVFESMGILLLQEKGLDQN